VLFYSVCYSNLFQLQKKCFCVHYLYNLLEKLLRNSNKFEKQTELEHFEKRKIFYFLKKKTIVIKRGNFEGRQSNIFKEKEEFNKEFEEKVENKFLERKG